MKSKIHKSFTKVIIVSLCFFISGVLLFQGDAKAKKKGDPVFVFKTQVELNKMLPAAKSIFVWIEIHSKKISKRIARSSSEWYDIDDDGSLSEEITVTFYEKNFQFYPSGMATHYIAKLLMRGGKPLEEGVAPKLAPEEKDVKFDDMWMGWKLAHPSGFVPEVTGPLNQKKIVNIGKELLNFKKDKK